MYLYRQQQLFFTTSYRELKRLDSVSRSPIYALFGETLDGVSTIRAFAAQVPLVNRMTHMLDQQQHAYFLTSTAQCWLGVRLEMIGTCIITFACLTAVASHDAKAGDETYAGLTGLAISYALAVTQALNWTVRMASDFEANMISVERIEQYGKLKTEAPHKLPTDENLDKDWPQTGKIEFKGAKLRYRPGLPLVLKGLDLSIPEFSKVGIVGRTGAGKSTLMTALLRIVELDEGKLFIDGVDTSTLGLARLRSRIAVIPQDPVLFTGTVKSNLDPFDEYSEEKLCQVLTRVGLMSLEPTMSGSTAIKSLSDAVLDGGSNFSVGEKQLLVIARACLCQARVVICDEATAAVDAETDARIQRVLRFDFDKATVLTVAHRLNTIMDSDYILVMDDGRAAEFDAPSKLLAKQDGLFKKLVDTWEEQHDR
jgi:ATP-binding cassette, subfamily C (CFTR/MRP), member 1